MTAALAEQQRPVHVQAASLELRVAENAAEIEAAQALRYRVFYEELNAQPTPEMSALRRDFDSFDPYCDHLIIIDRAKGEGAAGIIATYRLMRREQASRRGQFYSIDEYDISAAGELSRRDPRARPLLRRSRLSHQGGDEPDVEGHRRLHPALQDRRAVRLRLVPRHRSGGAQDGAVLSLSPAPGAGGVSRRARCPAAMSR